MTKYFYDLKIRNKILLSLGCLFSLLVVVGAVTYDGARRIETFRAKAALSEKKLVALTNFRAVVRNRILETYDVVFIEQLAKSEKTRAASVAASDSLILLKKIFDEDSEEMNLYKLFEAYKKLDLSLDSSLKLAREGDDLKTHEMLRWAREQDFNTVFLGEISQLIEKAKIRANTDSENLKASTDQKNKWIILISVFGAVLTGLLAFLLSQSIAVKLGRLEEAANEISNGNFDVAIPVTDRDELSRLTIVLNEMAISLKLYKERLLAQQEVLVATSKMAALGELSGGVAHELNTPLATILLLTNQMLGAIQNSAYDENAFVDAMTNIDATVTRIAKIVQGLRAFSRDNKKDPTVEYSLSALVDENFMLCSDKFMEAGIELKFECPRDVIVSCRSGEISQVLANLLSNSFDAVQDLKEKWVRVELHEEASCVRLSVTDSGHGIPIEIQPKLMQPFFTTKELGKGTGLGLSVAKGLIEGHGGQIVLENSANTSFSIIFPKDLVCGAEKAA